jgi:putative transcriptional regulator
MADRKLSSDSSMRIQTLIGALMFCLLAGGLGAASGLPTEEPARGKFLIAGPEMRDPNFSETVVLLLEYDETGALGLIINWPTELPADHVLPDIEGLTESAHQVFIGGPVQRGQITLLVQADEAPGDARHVFADIYFSGSGDLLRQLAAEKESDKQFRLYLGFAGWSAGQLDAELARGGWRILPGEAPMVFDPSPETVWSELVERSNIHWTILPVPRSGTADLIGGLEVASP